MIHEKPNIPAEIQARFKPALHSTGWTLPLTAVCNSEDEEQELRLKYSSPKTSVVVSVNAKVVDEQRWKGIYVG